MGASRVAELARAEADDAEREEDEETTPTETPAEAPTDDDGTEPEHPEEVETPGALAAIGPEEIKRAEKARDDQRKRLAKILGPEYVAHECLLCSGLGFLPEIMAAGTTFELVEQDGGIALAVHAPKTDADLKVAPFLEECQLCDGHGYFLPPTKNPFMEKVPCNICHGNGYVQTGGNAAAVSWTDSAQPNGEGAPGAAVPGLGPDAWGREHGHKHWGVPPNLIGIEP